MLVRGTKSDGKRRAIFGDQKRNVPDRILRRHHKRADGQAGLVGEVSARAGLHFLPESFANLFPHQLAQPFIFLHHQNVVMRLGQQPLLHAAAHFAQAVATLARQFDHRRAEIDADAAQALIARLRERLADLPGRTHRGHKIEAADDFAYTDPVDGSVSRQQGIRLLFEGGSRIVFRLSGTGTAGATLRVYLERFEPDPALQDLETGAALADLAAIAEAIAEIRVRTGRSAPSVIT